MSEDLVNIEIDGRPLKAPRGAMVITVADDAGIFIPRFCYHKKLSVAANCRMCLVEVEKAPKPLPACATPVADGMKVFTRSQLAKQAQRAVMEFLLINHPLDCPICDQGGECELQDVAMGFGGDISRFQERKRVVQDKDIGSLIATDMTRCIHCTRCVRFGEEIAGLRELGATGRGEHMEIGTFVEHSIASELSGNVIDLCPVGALTSKPFRFRARAWEMMSKPSIAPHDAIGSNINLHINRGRVLRVVPRENEAVNETWIADRDRFSYQGLYSEDRLQIPMIKRAGHWEESDWETALRFAVSGLQAIIAERGVSQMGALAGPSVTLEEAYLLQKLMRGIGCANIDHRLRVQDFSDQDADPLFPWLGQSLAALEQVDAALLVGSNCRKEQPLANHRLRKAALRGARIMAVNSIAYDFNYPLAASVCTSPVRIIETLAGVLQALGPAGDEADTARVRSLLRGKKGGSAEHQLAEILREASRPTLLLGPAALYHPQAAVLRWLAARVAERSGATFGYLAEGANSAGAWLAGLLPHRTVGGKPAETRGLNAASLLTQRLAAYVLLGIEPEYDCGNSGEAQQALQQAEFSVVLTAFRTPFMDRYANVLLPIAPFAETGGTFVNAEGRWQSFEAAVTPQGESRPAWRVLRVLGNLFALEGFQYQEAVEVRDEVRQATDSTPPDNLELGRIPPQPPKPEQSGLTRVGDVPIYAVDPLVRRAQALQQTVDAATAAFRINRRQAAALKLRDGIRIAVAQNSARVELPVVIDDRIADGCVEIVSAVAGSVGLGASFGPIAVEMAEVEEAS
jgi:NADH-quinone oxidoreductase subunit G